MIVNPAQRAQIVDFILKRKRFSNNTNESYAFGITKLIKDRVYEAAFPLHEGECHSSDDKAPRKWLLNNWASFSTIFKKQPLDDIKEYFGVKIGLYFAWLGFYTCMLIPASAVGVLCFLYGFFTLVGDAHSKDVCENHKDIILYPRCDIKGCKYEQLGQTCTFVRITHLFDNGAAVFFAVFMSLWAVIFMELWKRYSAKITHHWDVTNFDTLEVNEPCVSFWKRRVPCTIFSWSVVLLLIYRRIATFLTELEIHHTQTEHENSLTLKMYLL
ncbi:anoctamin-2-like isoform X2 [Tachypleus tridentatus]|uniref:anoctamin-2-like isoform X2 n=1 Tax=Tachypleus tridentatus TaxID=6853 RepID=UPI003FD4C77E